MKPRRQAGFTLLEVMMALSVLFAALVVLIDRSAHDVHLTERAEKLSIATDLTRSKIYDIEEELIQEGFQETDQEEEGDFSDEGWEGFDWKYKIEKMELPQLSGLEALAGAEEGEEGAEGGAGENPLLGLLAMGGGGEAGAAGAGFLASQFEIISNVLESAIRKVTLTVSWKVGDRKEELTTSVYFTSPEAVDQAIGGGGAPPPDEPPGGP